MMTAADMSGEQVARTDAFVEALREMIGNTLVSSSSLCADQQCCGLARIAATLDAVDYTTLCNLANADAALNGALLNLLEVQLMAVGTGPTLDFADATAFLARLDRLITAAMKRRLQ